MKFKATFFGGSFNDKETLEYKETYSEFIKKF